MKESTRRVLETLQTRSADTWHLAALAGIRPASVRRSIQELRQEGYNIVYRGGFASLLVEQPVQQTEQASA